MKSEKICISKKNLIISLIAVFLLGVVGVSYMVQRSLTLRSKADAPLLGFGDCNTLFDSQMENLGKKKDDASLTIFRNRFVENNRMIAYTGGVNGNGCPTDGYLGAFSRNNEVSYTPKQGTSEEDILENTRGLTSGRVCCIKRNSEDNLGVKGEMNKLGLELAEGRFTNSGTTPITVGSVKENPTVCTNYQPVPGVDNGVRSEQYCGPKGSEYEYSEDCTTSDGKTPGIRAIHVGCGVVGKDGLNSCEFSCFNGVDWNNVCRKADGTENPNVCLVPSPTPMKSPAANTYNSTNQTNTVPIINCQPPGPRGNFVCWANSDTKEKGTPYKDGSNYFVTLLIDDKKRRVVSRVGESPTLKDEVCTMKVGDSVVPGICASKNFLQ